MSMLGFRQTLLMVQQTGCDCPLARTCSFLQVTTQWNQTTFMQSFAWSKYDRLTVFNDTYRFKRNSFGKSIIHVCKLLIHGQTLVVCGKCMILNINRDQMNKIIH